MAFNRQNQQYLKKFSITSLLRSQGKITDEFEVMLNNLSLEELIALKLEISSRFLKGRMYGLNLFKSLPRIARDAAVKYAISACGNKNEAALILGVTTKTLYSIIRSTSVIRFKENVLDKKADG